MSLIQKESIEKVLEATDLVALISSYIQVKRAGSQFKANCPFHHEKTPSFYITPHTQTYHCFGCGAHGDAISFVKDYENLPFSEAVQKLAARAGVPLLEEAESPEAGRMRKGRGRLIELHRQMAEFLHQQLLTNPDAEHARSYLKARGFDRELAARWLLGWMPERAEAFLEWARKAKFSGRELIDGGIATLRDEQRSNSGLYVRFLDRLMFPIRNEMGDVIAFSGRQLKENKNSGKYINSPETALFKKSRVFFGLDRAAKPILTEKAALLCEGQIDTICCHEMGISHAIATCGTACTADHAKLLRRYTRDVLICYDADAAGRTATEKAFREFAVAGMLVKVVEMPSGDDPDSFIKKNGGPAFRGLLDSAQDFFLYKLGYAKQNGLLESARGRTQAISECVEMLALMSDFAARDTQLNMIANFLQTSAVEIRSAVASKLKFTRKQSERRAENAEVKESQAVQAVPLHRTIGFMCHLALSSGTAQQFLAEQFEIIHHANRWLEGVGLLDKILSVRPDPSSPAAINAFLCQLPEEERLALVFEENPKSDSAVDWLQQAEQALAVLSATLLQSRDAAVKAELKEPGLDAKRMIELLEEAKEISNLLRGLDQRFVFSDELPESTWRPKEPAWKLRKFSS